MTTAGTTAFVVDARTAMNECWKTEQSIWRYGNNYKGLNMKSMNDMARLIDAVEFAARKHSSQRRKDVDASPYINHPIAVASVLAVEAGVSDLATLQAAILHDTVEDTETTYGELVERFGAAVADVVMEVTDDKSLPKDERKRLQIAHAHKKSKQAAMVKIADKTCNLRDIVSSPPAGWSDEKKREYFDWAKAVVDGLPVVNQELADLFGRAYGQRK